MATMKDISREAGVSEPVVSAVLNKSKGRIKASPETAAKIRQIAERLGYRPNLVARKLAGKKSKIIGVVMDTTAPQIYHDRLSQMELYAAEKGYRFMLGQAHNDVKKIQEYAEFFSDYGVDGLICMAHNYPDSSHKIAEFFLKKNKTVFFEQPEGIPDAYCVSIDIASNFRQAVNLLYQKGRRRIGLFRTYDFYCNPTMDICQSGYQNALLSNGMKIDPQLIVSVSHQQLKSVEAGHPLIKKLVDTKVDAIICVNDYMAAVAINCLQEMQIEIPKQIAVIGCDNLDVATLVRPSITTFEQHNDQVAVHLVDMMTAQIEGREIPPEERKVIIKPTLISRESA